MNQKNTAWKCPDCGNGEQYNHRGCEMFPARNAAPQVDGVPTDKQIDDAAFALGIQGYAYVDDPAGYRTLVRQFAAAPQPAAQEQEKDADFLNDLRWRINDVQEMLASGYTTDEWSVPVVNLKTAIKRIDAAISAQSAGEKGE